MKPSSGSSKGLMGLSDKQFPQLSIKFGTIGGVILVKKEQHLAFGSGDRRGNGFTIMALFIQLETT